VRAGGLAQRSQQRRCVVGASRSPKVDYAYGDNWGGVGGPLWRPRPCDRATRTGSAMLEAVTGLCREMANGPQIDHRNPVNGCERTRSNATKNVDSN
jgi:hypothetical protein